MGIITWVIYLKKSTKVFFKTVIISAWCLSVFLGIGYYYLSKNLTPTEVETPDVPYYQEAPQNAGILFELLGEKTFIYLDFEDGKLTVCLNPVNDELNDGDIYGYTVDYNITADLEYIEKLVDYLDGIDLTLENQPLRYTGVQVVNLLVKDKELLYKPYILKAIINKTALNGIGKDFLLETVETCKTNLTVPDVYYWPEYIKIICSNLQIIDS